MGSGGDNSIISSNAAFAGKSSAEKLVCHRSAARRRSTGAVRSRKMAPQIAGGGVSAAAFNSSMNLVASKRLASPRLGIELLSLDRPDHSEGWRFVDLNVLQSSYRAAANSHSGP